MGVFASTAVLLMLSMYMVCITGWTRRVRSVGARKVVGGVGAPPPFPVWRPFFLGLLGGIDPM